MAAAATAFVAAPAAAQESDSEEAIVVTGSRIVRQDYVANSPGVTEMQDGETQMISFALGGEFADGRGHGMMMASWNKREAIYNGARPFSGISGPVCGSPNPEWRHRFRTTWSSPWNLDVSLTWRYMGEVQQVNASNEALDAGLDRAFDAENYFDISGNYQLLENTKLRFGVNNVLDNDPPLSGRSGNLNGNTYPQVYDSLGRWVFAGLTVDW